MSWFIIALIAAGSVLIVLLLMVVVTQLKSTRHIEDLKKRVEHPEKKEKKERPGTRSGARPAARPEKKVSEPVREAPSVSEEVKPAAPSAPAAPEPSVSPEPAPAEKVPVEEAPVEEAPVEKTPAAEAPTVYPEFDNTRAVEQLGLSQEEADMFIAELVSQIEGEFSSLEAALEAKDCEKLEKISHMLKGSATSLGEGGVADVLVAFNTYCKDGDDMTVVRRHIDDLRHYFEKLKAKYAA